MLFFAAGRKKNYAFPLETVHSLSPVFAGEVKLRSFLSESIASPSGVIKEEHLPDLVLYLPPFGMLYRVITCQMNVECDYLTNIIRKPIIACKCVTVALIQLNLNFLMGVVRKFLRN